MLPPENYTDLCEYPPEDVIQGMLLESGTTPGSLPIDFQYTPIGLLVPLAVGRDGPYDCDLLTKIQVALAIQRNMTKDNQLWSVIFYNDNLDYMMNLEIVVFILWVCIHFGTPT